MLKEILTKLIALITAIFIVSVTVLLGKELLSSKLYVMASSQNQWTGVAVSRSGRIFVNYPTWSDSVPIKVAEIKQFCAKPYPDINTNNKLFKAVQSVFIDKKDRLWILDTCNPQFKGVLDGGPKLYQYNLKKNKLVKVYTFPANTYHNNSYFNDIRIDENRNYAYITDSGSGAIIVLNLTTQKARRLLENSQSVKSETDHLICNGIRWENNVDSDGIALTPNRKYLYYIALTSHSLYRIRTAALRNENLSAEKLEKMVEYVAKIPATDGMIFDDLGNLYLGGLEDNSINMLTKNKKLKKFVRSNPLIRWADSFALDSAGNLLFTTSQIYLPEEKRIKYQLICVYLTYK